MSTSVMVDVHKEEFDCFEVNFMVKFGCVWKQ